MSEPSDVSGIAALTILESLLLALNDHKVLPEHEIRGVLKDASATHENVPAGSKKADLHKAVSVLINSIQDGGNSARRI
jgi:hypothetical protein